MPHLLNVWPRVSRQIAQASHLLLLSDYDGTLAPIAGRPDLALLPGDTRAALVEVNNRLETTLGIVSGRGLANVRSMVGIPGLIYAGNHGMEIEGPGISFRHPEAEELEPLLDSILAELERRLSGVDGVYVEGKGLTLSVHYRLAPAEARPSVFAEFDEVLEKATGGEGVRVTRGKEILEVRPNIDWHKGRAIARIASGFPTGTLSMYLGDDLTDEDGFQAIHQLNGISVFVGEAREPTRAQYRLDSPTEVAETLRLIAGLRGQES